MPVILDVTDAVTDLSIDQGEWKPVHDDPSIYHIPFIVEPQEVTLWLSPDHSWEVTVLRYLINRQILPVIKAHDYSFHCLFISVERYCIRMKVSKITIKGSL